MGFHIFHVLQKQGRAVARGINRVVFLLPVAQFFQPIQDFIVLPRNNVAALLFSFVLIGGFVGVDI